IATLSLFLALSLGASALRAAPDDAVTPNENLVLQGIPPIPKSLAERVGPYMEFRAAALVDWHPTRREALIATRFAEVPQLHRVAFPGGARQQITFFREPITQAEYRPRLKSEGEQGFVFARDVGGSEFYQLFWRAENSPQARMFTDGRSRNSLGP